MILQRSVLTTLAAAVFVAVPSNAFVMPARSHHHQQVTALASADSDDILVLNGVNIDVTDALESHVSKKIGTTLTKLGRSADITMCDVVLSVSKNPKVKNGHMVEVVTNVKGTTIICKTESPDMYSSIDQAAHAMTRKLKRYKERRTQGWHGGDNMEADMAAAIEALDDDDAALDDEFDSYGDDASSSSSAQKVMKVNSFDLETPTSLDEAIFALDYVDHDFYVFKDKDTKKVSVVYKRHTGGVGLIE